MKPRIYLAGYTGETAYRQYAKDNYGKDLILFDPMTDIEHDLDPDVKNNFHIVQQEKRIIDRNTDILVAYIRQFTIGTTMEIMHAYNNSIPVFVITPTPKFERDLWLAYHASRFFPTIDDCFNYILSLIPAQS